MQGDTTALMNHANPDELLELSPVDDITAHLDNISAHKQDASHVNSQFCTVRTHNVRNNVV